MLDDRQTSELRRKRKREIEREERRGDERREDRDTHYYFGQDMDTKIL